MHLYKVIAGNKDIL